MLGYKEVTHEGGEPREDRLSLEALTHQLIQEEQDTTMIPAQEELEDADEVGIVEDIQTLQRMLVGDMPAGKAGDAVKHRERIAHPPISLLGDEPERRLLGIDTLAIGDVAQMAGDILHGDSLEVIDLTAREDGGEDLVLLRRR